MGKWPPPPPDEKITAPLLRMVWNATLPKPKKRYENDHHFNRLER
jgi:hypothetical protein